MTIGVPTRCCSIDYTGKDTITKPNDGPSLVDLGIYIVAYLVVICFIFKWLEDIDARRKQHKFLRRCNEKTGSFTQE